MRSIQEVINENTDDGVVNEGIFQDGLMAYRVASNLLYAGAHELMRVLSYGKLLIYALKSYKYLVPLSKVVKSIIKNKEMVDNTVYGSKLFEPDGLMADSMRFTTPSTPFYKGIKNIREELDQDMSQSLDDSGYNAYTKLMDDLEALAATC